jgi:hypothetical protein
MDVGKNHQKLLKNKIWMRRTIKKLQNIDILVIEFNFKRKKIRTRRVFEPSTNHATGDVSHNHH